MATTQRVAQLFNSCIMAHDAVDDGGGMAAAAAVVHERAGDDDF